MAGEVNALLLNPKDNVCIVLEDLNPGDDTVFVLEGNTVAIKALERVPIYHKMAAAVICPEETVYKYGQAIGKASQAIKAGQHVHSHNLVSIRENITV